MDKAGPGRQFKPVHSVERTKGKPSFDLADMPSVAGGLRVEMRSKANDAAALACEELSFGVDHLSADVDINYPFSTALRDGSTILLGTGLKRADSLPNYRFYGYVAKMDPGGNVVWAREVKHPAPYRTFLTVAKELPDGQLLIAGEIDSTSPTGAYQGDLVLMQLTATGDLVWHRRFVGSGFAPLTTNAEVQPWDIELEADESFLLAGNIFENAAPGRVFAAKFDPAGRLIWSRTIAPQDGTARVAGITRNGSDVKLFFVGQEYINTIQNFIVAGDAHLDEATGTLAYSRTWNMDLPPVPNNAVPHMWANWPKLAKLPDGRTIIHGSTFWKLAGGPGVSPHFAAAEFDPSGGLTSAYEVISAHPVNTSSEVNSSSWGDKILFYESNGINGFTDQELFITTLENGQFTHQRLIAGVPLLQGYMTCAVMADGSSVVVNGVNDATDHTHHLVFRKLHDADVGQTCVGGPLGDLTVSMTPYIPYGRVFGTLNNTLFRPSALAAPVLTDLGYASAPLCSVRSRCDTLKIHGETNFCGRGQEITFTTFKNASCGAWTTWSMDTTVLSEFTIPNDSTLRIRFKQDFTGWLKANISTTCGDISDSVFIKSIEPGGPVHLPADTTLCAGDSIRLSATDRYASYLWSDASTDSVLIVSTAGQYRVLVKDACGLSFQDTVQVDFHPVASINIGPDRSICAGDTVHLKAPPGYAGYAWSPSYRLSSATGQEVVADPLVDTLYIVRAEQWPGCFARDTIRVRLRSAPKVDLGPDLRFCSGDSAVVSSAGPYVRFAWSNGDTTAQVIVKNASVLRLTATDVNGCRSSDTISILEPWPLPAVRLPDVPALCVGGTNTLDAGVFSRYLWQDGSTARQFQVVDTGRYTVRVWDQHGCTNADSVTIAQFSPKPVGFLPADTSKCSYDVLTLSPDRNFAGYAWSTGATTGSIVVNDPGVYSLLVVDALGCEGLDSITVGAKACAVGFHMPNAFTPNSDGINDRIRPLIDGRIEEYAFSIFDRWGKKVFSSKDAHDSWDGVYMGQKEPSQTYTWVCYLKLSGQDGQWHKGTLTLLR